MAKTKVPSWMRERAAAVYAAIVKVELVGGVGIRIPSANGQTDLLIKPRGWDLAEIRKNVARLVGGDHATDGTADASVAADATEEDERDSMDVDRTSGDANNNASPASVTNPTAPSTDAAAPSITSPRSPASSTDPSQLPPPPRRRADCCRSRHHKCAGCWPACCCRTRCRRARCRHQRGRCCSH
ncbi:hypothetical protein BCR44DRAFT_363851 [Catenaria anguillulae PL171]|uniref:Uncharacterized protein n=1 Tax=Catenaria anguillulae PL171 TaxID=765915 RepID=A0A1Y2HG86_9FUNG|nr:hypothetical protein BCR44DRAFT_363851 [Catenaria anguillulae PL171]